MRNLPDLPPRTVKMLRVPQPHELPTSEIPVYEEEGDIMEPIHRHDDDDEDDYFIEGKPGSFKNRQIQYMTAAIIWTIIAAALLIFGSVVWRICLAIAS